MGRPKGLDSNEDAVDFRQSGLDKSFLKMLARRQDCVSQIKTLEADRKDMTDQMVAALAEAGHKTVLTPDWRVTFVQSTSASRIDGRKLLELGVSARVIEKATVKGKTYETVAVTPVKGVE